MDQVSTELRETKKRLEEAEQQAAILATNLAAANLSRYDVGERADGQNEDAHKVSSWHRSAFIRKHLT